MRLTVLILLAALVRVFANTSLTLSQLWKPEDWTRADARELSIVDDDLIIAGGR